MKNSEEFRVRGAAEVEPAVSGGDPGAKGCIYFGLEVSRASAPFQAAVELMRLIATTRAHTLIEGETGTGKELAARAIHYYGARRARPFVPINCGALPEDLLESELFGHTRGAFTDARQASPGLVAHAQGGTLFLDEIECLSARAQATLLRFLQSGEYRAVGSPTTATADVRVIAASNVELIDLVRAGRFRQDLMYRLQVMSLKMPPLRARGDDVLMLAEHFVRKYQREYGVGPLVLDPASDDALRAHDWPGNVRELENLVQRQLLLVSDGVLRLRPVIDPNATNGSHAPAVSDATHITTPRTTAGATATAITGAVGAALLGEPHAVELAEIWHQHTLVMGLPLQEAKALAIARFERAYLVQAITAAGWNVACAARHSGKERRAFGKLLKKYGIERRHRSDDSTIGAA